MISLLLGFNIMSIVYIIIAVFALMFMVTIHELGHYLAGKLLGFKINEFSIGMGPKIFSKKLKKKKGKNREKELAPKKEGDFFDEEEKAVENEEEGEIFSIKALPLGGYCAFEGEDEDIEKKVENENGEKVKVLNKDAFNAQKPWKRVLVLLCGPLFNIISAALIAMIVFMTYGDHLPTIAKVYETSPNYANETIKDGDVIYSVDGKFFYMYNDALTMISEADDTLDLVVIRNGEKIELRNVKKGRYTYQTQQVDENGKPMTDEQGNPIMIEKEATGIGVTINSPEPTHFGFFESVGRGVCYTGRTSVYIIQVFLDMITGKIALDQIGGPITTIDITAQAVSTNFMNIFFIIMLISVNLGVFNLLPIPALDGSRILFVIIEWIAGRPIVSRKVEAIIHLVGMVILFAFVILVDVLRFV